MTQKAHIKKNSLRHDKAGLELQTSRSSKHIFYNGWAMKKTTRSKYAEHERRVYFVKNNNCPITIAFHITCTN